MSAPTKEAAAPETGTDKRFIQMKMFATPQIMERIAIASQRMKTPGGLPVAEEDKEIAAGQIVGEILKIEVKEYEDRETGELREAWQAYGDFECAVYETSKVFTSGAAYLPKYILETAKAILDQGKSSVEFAGEVRIVATGKAIPFAYEIARLVSRRRGNAIDKLKAQMAERGLLKGLPAPDMTLVVPDVDQLTPLPPVGASQIATEAAQGEIVEGEVLGGREAEDGDGGKAGDSENDSPEFHQPVSEQARAKAPRRG